MDRSIATVPEPVYRLAEGVLFQQLGREAVLLNMKTAQYLGLDPVIPRIWQLLTGTHSGEVTVTSMPMRAEDSPTDAPRA